MEYRALVALIDEYTRIAEKSDTNVTPSIGRNAPKQSVSSTDPTHMHLFDLLRDRQLFPSNSDLSDFAARVLPSMTSKRFDKMSRGEIVAKLIDYVETRDAMIAKPEKTSDRKSFFSKWEKIIKETQL